MMQIIWINQSLESSRALPKSGEAFAIASEQRVVGSDKSHSFGLPEWQCLSAQISSSTRGTRVNDDCVDESTLLLHSYFFVRHNLFKSKKVFSIFPCRNKYALTFSLLLFPFLIEYYSILIFERRVNIMWIREIVINFTVSARLP